MIDLADEPVLPASARLRLAALALRLGLSYEAPGRGSSRRAYVRRPFDGPMLSVIGTGKRTGKTAVARPLGRALRAMPAATR